METRVVRLPKPVIHETPMTLKTDAYTSGSEHFESEKAKEKSSYYVTFRRELVKINSDLFEKGDNRIIFCGLSRIIQYLLFKATSLYELGETEACLRTAQATTEGLKPWPFPYHLWKRVVEEFNGRPPIQIKAVREGSVVYPNEPNIVCTSLVDGFGELAAWFESSALKVFSSSEMVTQLAHWFEYCYSVVTAVHGNHKTKEEKRFLASLMLHNFACRAGMTPEISEWLGADSLLIFPGTDTWAGAYQHWKNSGEADGLFYSVPALAHRNVESFPSEKECYETMYNNCPNGTINSMVNDCYSGYDAVEKYHLPLAKHAAETKNGKVIVSRFDSGNAEEEVLWLCKLAHKHLLSTVETIDGKEWRFGTTLKTLEGDSMRWASMKKIMATMMEHGFAPFAWGPPFGVGGGTLEVNRDHLSAKYALCAVGNDNEGVCKFSDTLEKGTLPGPFKLLRSKEALDAKKTIVGIDEPGEDVLVEYFNGLDIWDPFKEGFGEDRRVVSARIFEQMETMPKTLTTAENHNYPCSDAIRDKRIALLKKHAPKKLVQNY